MSGHPLDQLDPRTPSSDSISSIVRTRKRDKFRESWGFSKSNSKTKEVKPKALNQSLHSRPSPQHSTGPPVVSQTCNVPLGDKQPFTSSGVQDKPLPLLPTEAQPLADLFAANLSKPTIKAQLPRLQERIENTEQLVYCNTLLLQYSLSSHVAVTEQEEDVMEVVAVLQELAFDKAELDWLQTTKKDPMEADRLRWIATRVVEQFMADASKDSTKVAEIVALGPVLEKEPYRKLLSNFIKEFEDTRILDVDMLQGLVQLVQNTSTGYLVSDDLVKIFGILRIRLQATHQQSTEHSYHLTLAVSRILDVMADHKVQDLDRVLEHEPLSAVLSGLKDNSDPYLMYQTCYAFQALQYVPDNESALQTVLRHSTGVVDGLVKVTAVFKLDLASVLEGLSTLQEALGGAISVASTVYEGVSSLMESDRGVLDSLKEGYRSGHKRPWYLAVKVANAFAQAGQLKDLKRLVVEVPCRRDPLFQWGICQLLGEMAVDPLWPISARQQSVSLLGHLCQHDQDWGQDESVKAWMLTIITKLCASPDQAISDTAHSVLQGLGVDQSASAKHPYPLRARLPLPSASPLLAKVQSIQYLEYDLHKFRLQRFEAANLPIYISPMAKANLQACDDDIFPLEENVQEFLVSERQVMLILGESGAGKSTFNKHLESELLRTYTRGGPIPLFISLPAIGRPDKDLIGEHLRTNNFSEVQIQELKQYRKFVLICDGYDESQLTANLHTTNLFNQPGQWKVKMVISCRTQFLGQNCRSCFIPDGTDHYTRQATELFQEAVIAPFSKEQIEDYVEQYVPLEPRTWTTKDYMDKLTTIPNLMDLVKNPFLLFLSLEALPGVTEGQQNLLAIKITRVQLYDTFVRHWFDVNSRRLQRNVLTKEDRDMLGHLVEAGFISMGIGYATRLALAIFEHQDGNPVVQYVHIKDEKTWRAEFFGPDPGARMLRESSPLNRIGNQFRFLHRSILEYFLSCAVFDPNTHEVDGECCPQSSLDPTPAQLLAPDGPLFKRNLLTEPSVIQFLCERVKLHPDFAKKLLAVIEQSKTDSNVATAATNAITILVKAGAPFNGADLQGVRIPGADLSNGQFDSAQFQGADLTDVILSGSWLRQADLSGARLEGVRFGELPYLKIGGKINACTYSPDRRMFAVCFWIRGLIIYETSTWTVIHRFTIAGVVLDIAFSPDSLQIVSVGTEGALQTWDCTSGKEVLAMSGHTKTVYSVAFSPCGKQIASASGDRTVRLWDSQTGDSLFSLEGHTELITSVKYSPDGSQLVSGSKDKTIRFWNPQTSEPGAVLSPSLGDVLCLAYSPDGRWIASGHNKGILQLWIAATREPDLMLKGHSQSVTGVDYSPNGQWIASASHDETVRLWDAHNGTLLSVWTGHSSYIKCVAFSPDNLQVASGGFDENVRLWEVDSAWSSLDPRNGGSVDQVTYDPDGRIILGNNSCQAIRMWDARTGASTEPIPLGFAEPQEVSCMAFTRDVSQLAVGCKDGCIHLMNPQTAGPTLEGHSCKVRMLVYSPCCRWIASVDDENTMRLWDLHNTEQQRVLVDVDDELEEKIRVVVFSPNGDQLAVGSQFGTVRLFGLPSTEQLTCNKLTERGVVSMAYSPNGRQLAIGVEDGGIYFWDLQSEKPGAQLEGYGHWVHCVAYSPCGEWIASGGSDQKVYIWRRQLMGEVESWSIFYSINSFFGPVENVAWNPVVYMEFLTGSWDGSIRVWRASINKDECVVFNMLWGSNLGVLYANDLVLDNDTGLSPINQTLLVQRGAVSSIPNQEEQE